MKKIILEEKISEIHIDDVTTKNVILVKKEGNEFGVILYVDGWWIGKTSSNTKTNIDISVVIKWFGANCEFYVLD